MNGVLGRAPMDERFLKKTLGLGAMVAILFFSVSGGPYGLEATISESGAGVGLLLLVLIPIIYSLPSGLVVSELGTMMPVEGGYYHWVKTSLGPFMGFAEAWWTWVVSWVDLAVYPVLFVEYLEYWFPDITENRLQTWLIALAVTWVFALVNILGVKSVGDSSKLFLTVVLAPFVLVTVIGIFKMTHNPFEPAMSEGNSFLPAFGAGLFLVMWNYSGFDALSTYSAEIVHPRRDIPKAIFRSIPLIMACYLIPIIVSLAAVGVGGRNGVLWEDGDFSTVAEIIAGPWLAHLLTAAALFSAVGLYSAWLLSYSRLPYVLSEDGYLPHAVSKVSPRFGTPVVAILISAVICSIFVYGSFADLIAIDVTIDTVAIGLEYVALIAMRAKYPDAERPYRIRGGWPMIVLISIPIVMIYVVAIYYQVDEEGAVKGLLWPGIAMITVLLYFPLSAYKRRNGRDVTYAPDGTLIDPDEVSGTAPAPI